MFKKQVCFFSFWPLMCVVPLYSHNRLLLLGCSSFSHAYNSVYKLHSSLFFFFFLIGKQAIANNVVTVGYIMKPSREEDFAKVSFCKEMKVNSVTRKDND